MVPVPEPIVCDDRDGERFLETSAEMVRRFGVAIHANCLIVNYSHLSAADAAGEPQRR
jgi:hypothetical protein